VLRGGDTGRYGRTKGKETALLVLLKFWPRKRESPRMLETGRLRGETEEGCLGRSEGKYGLQLAISDEKKKKTKRLANRGGEIGETSFRLIPLLPHDCMRWGKRGDRTAKG